MDARMGAEAITTRIGAVAFPLAIIFFVVSTAIFHPSGEAMNNPVIFMVYAGFAHKVSLAHKVARLPINYKQLQEEGPGSCYAPALTLPHLAMPHLTMPNQTMPGLERTNCIT